ncbi:uncharacterized protein [Temnothorax nylanderi]|uniref:uncharacterized protein n=1 Tax=Temnothorax nylanderi TaxID=102681 RepID=UPI003A899B25
MKKILSSVYVWFFHNLLLLSQVIFVELLDEGIGTLPCTGAYLSFFIILSEEGERSLKTEGCSHGYRAHTRVPLIRGSEWIYVATKINADIALSPKIHKDELSFGRSLTLRLSSTGCFCERYRRPMLNVHLYVYFK